MALLRSLVHIAYQRECDGVFLRTPKEGDLDGPSVADMMDSFNSDPYAPQLLLPLRSERFKDYLHPGTKNDPILVVDEDAPCLR